MITIDGKQHEEADLTDVEKYLLAQMQDLDFKLQRLEFKKNQLQVAREAFYNALVQSFKQAETEREDPSSGNVEG